MAWRGAIVSKVYIEKFNKSSARETFFFRCFNVVKNVLHEGRGIKGGEQKKNTTRSRARMKNFFSKHNFALPEERGEKFFILNARSGGRRVEGR